MIENEPIGSVKTWNALVYHCIVNIPLVFLITDTACHSIIAPKCIYWRVSIYWFGSEHLKEDIINC